MYLETAGTGGSLSAALKRQRETYTEAVVEAGDTIVVPERFF